MVTVAVLGSVTMAGIRVAVVTAAGLSSACITGVSTTVVTVAVRGSVTMAGVRVSAVTARSGRNCLKKVE